MSLFEVNFLAVLVAAIVGFLIGWLWYSPLLFCNAWLESREKKKEECKASPMHFVGGFVLAFLTAWALAYIYNIAAITDLSQGYKTTLIIWLGLIATTMFSGVIWSSYKFNTFLIDVGYKLVMFLVMATILILWK